VICGVMHILEPQEWRLVSLRLDSLKWSFGEGPHMDFTSFMMGGILLLSRPIIFLYDRPIPCYTTEFLSQCTYGYCPSLVHRVSPMFAL